MPEGIGTLLREARIERDLSIEETAWRTRIRPDLLRALECDEFDTIGHQSFVRTHLSSYARFLGMDPADVVRRFESLHDDAPSSLEELQRRADEAHKPPRAKWLIAAAVCGAVLIAAGVMGALGTRTPAGGPVAVAPVAVAPVSLVVEALAPSTLRIVADGAAMFDGVLATGARRTFQASDVIDVTGSDGAGVRLTLNGVPVTAGARGAFHGRFGPRGPLG